ncbi:hypothetical protein D3C78_1368100 [compost metagenome]
MSSRSISSSGRPRMPPLRLISAAARRMPLRMLMPIGAEPPVNGPETPIRSASAALAASGRHSNSRRRVRYTGDS